MRVNILLADDHVMFREILRNMLRFYCREKQFVVIEEAGYGAEILSLVDRLYIDRRTVKNHVTHIFAKLGVTNRAQVTRYFLGNN